MNLKDQYIILSNSKYAGMSACRYFNGTYKNKKEISNYLLEHGHELKFLKTLMTKEAIDVVQLELNDYYDGPKYLLTKGCGDINHMSVAIIGARQCTEYGKKVAYDLAYQLSKLGIQIISGLAYGIDYAAHKGAVDGGGCTLAVLGSGVLNCYPKPHEKLYHLIQKKGLIVSEYGFYGKPLKHHFPFRNRLISALSEVLIVVEAKEKSGTMITVNYGLDQGKTIMAVPGPINSKLSEGTHALIKEGALLCTCVEDVIFQLKNLII